MNSLISPKTAENTKRNTEMRTLFPISIPQKYVNQSGNIKYSYKHKIYVKEFLRAQTITEQLTAVKTAFLHHKETDDSSALQFLADLFFSGPIKHPVRNQISKLFQQNENQGGVVKNKLYNAIKELVKSVSENAPTSAYNKCIVSLSGCFENFPEALTAFKQNIIDIFKLLCASLLIYLEDLKKQTSPSIRNELYLYIHNTIRVMLSCVQEFELLMAEKLMTELERLNYVLTTIMLDPDIPMDTKTNSGILTAYLSKIFKDYRSYAYKASSGICVKSLELCLCVGFINTITSQDFPELIAESVLIVDKIVSIANTYSTEPSMLLSATKSLFQFSKVLLSFNLPEICYETIQGLLKMLKQYVYLYLEHHMDTVRHICKDLLRNIIKLGDKLNFNDMISEIFEFCKSKETPISMKCVILTSLGMMLGANKVLAMYPKLIKEVFSDEIGTDLNVSNCFENLMIANYKEIDIEQWQETWISPLLRMCMKHSYKDKLTIIEELLNKAIKCDPSVVKQIINDKKRKRIPISTRLSALWTLRRNGIKVDGINNIFDEFHNDFRDAIISNCDDSKIMALRLIVDTHKTTEPLTEDECEFIMLYLNYNSNCQSPATRQKATGLLAKALTRLDANLARLIRAGLLRDHYYMKFLKDITLMLIENLFPGANFSRRCLSLNLIKDIVEILLKHEIDVNVILPKNAPEVLFANFGDSYEANKAVCVEILKMLKGKCEPPKSTQLSLANIAGFMVSVRPSDSVTSAYCLEHYCNQLTANDAKNVFNAKIQSVYQPVAFSAIKWSINLLEEGLKEAEKSIVIAAKYNPLYGVLFSIRNLLTKLDFKQIAADKPWRIIMSLLIRMCKTVTRVVGPIVNNSSPEGHLPNDFSDIVQYLDKPGADAEHFFRGCCPTTLRSKCSYRNDNLKVTPQMILLCAWRAVKEVSLLLGEIGLRSPIQGLTEIEEDYLITPEQLTDIGIHFKELLSETKHRGAFEQSFVGFVKICTRLWRVENVELSNLPILWLSELLQIISNEEHERNEKICATRRSAGLPFMFQALITSEIQIGTKKALSFCMKNLFKICANPTKSTESRTHALNILRALFRCTDLNEAIGEYIPDGVECSIRGYMASNWAEKNSSTLLFSALITRVFGVQRSKDIDKIDIRNKMTGRIFFLRYPRLYDFFLTELKDASKLILDNENSSKLHPLLLMLSRLYPSALEGTESNLKLSTFIPLISSCSGSPEFQTRVLAAKAVVAFIPFDVMSERAFEIMHILKNCKSMNSNMLHGLLLQIHFLLKPQKVLEHDYAVSVLSQLFQLTAVATLNAVTWTTVFEVFIDIIKKCDLPSIPYELNNKLTDLAYQGAYIFNEKFSFYYPVFYRTFFYFNSYFIGIMCTEADFVEFLLSNLDPNSSPYEEVDVCLSVVAVLFDDSSPEYDQSRDDIEVLQFFGSEKCNSLRQALAESPVFKSCMEAIVVNQKFFPECHAKAYFVLSELPSSINDLNELITNSRNQIGEVKNSITKCVETMVGQNALNDEQVSMCLDYLVEISENWSSTSIRITATLLLSNLSKYIFRAIANRETKVVSKFCNVVLLMLRDDDADVRDNVSLIVSELTDQDYSCDNIVASYAQVVFLRIIGEHLKGTNDSEFIKQVINEIHYSLGESDDEFDICDTEFELFDKNDANAFGEINKTYFDTLKVFADIFDGQADIMDVIYL